MEISEFISKNGNKVLKVDEYYMHSKYDQLKEAREIIEKKYKPHSINIVFGYGSGYLIDVLAEKNKFGELVIIIDPLLDRKLIDFRHNIEKLGILEYKHLELLEEEIRSKSTISCSRINIFCTKNYDKIFQNEYKEILKKVSSIQKVNQINDNTEIFFANKWLENLTENIAFLNKDSSLKWLKKKFDSAVVIASSGPSLLKQLPLLKKIYKNVILISSGSTTNVLRENNIEPHIITSIDGGEPNYNHFKNLEINNSILIHTFQNHPKIRDSFKKQAFLCHLDVKTSELEYLKRFSDMEIPVLQSGPSVASLSLSVAKYISSGPIAFIGQDLAFTDNLTHVEGHNNSKKTLIEDEDYCFVDGYFGEKVLTNSLLDSMRISLEKSLESDTETEEKYNCTEGGVKIKGLKQISFVEFVEKYVKDVTVDFELEIQPSITNELKIKKVLNQDLMKVERLIREYEKAEKIVISEINNLKISKQSLKKLDDIDARILKISKTLPIDHLLKPALYLVFNAFLEEEGETESQKYLRVMNKSLTYYQLSVTSVRKYEKMLLKVLEGAK